MKNKKLAMINGVITCCMLFFLSAPFASAHVVVKPAQVGVAAFQTFTVGVPNEKDMPTTQVRLVLPQGLKYVSPNVKPGWEIETKKDGEGENATVTEIIWTGGIIPVGQRDDFNFSAQVPAKEATLSWKAYQTYEDGTVVSWEEDTDKVKQMSEEQKEKLQKENKGPYSITKVINDLNTTTQPTKTEDKTLLYVSSAALVLSLLSLGMQVSRKK